MMTMLIKLTDAPRDPCELVTDSVPVPGFEAGYPVATCSPKGYNFPLRRGIHVFGQTVLVHAGRHARWFRDGGYAECTDQGIRGADAEVAAARSSTRA